MKATVIYPVVKEIIPLMTFPDTEVLESENDKAERVSDAYRASIIGNMERQKVRIFFRDFYSFKVVETTIWGVTDGTVILKSNTCIPLQRIFKIQLL